MADLNSRILIAKDIKLDKEHNNVLDYSESEMLQLLRSQSHLIQEKTNYNFTKQSSNQVDVDFTYSQCLQANYMAFQNPEYSNKWFFAFITDVEFLNPSTTRITFEIDDYATWFDYWDPKACYVIREHPNVSDDVVGANTIPENLETGEYKVNGEYMSDATDWSLKIVVGSTYNLESGGTWAVGNMFTGVYSGIPYYQWPISQDVDLTTKLTNMTQEQAQNAIQTLFLAPSFVVEEEGSTHYVRRGLASKITDIKVPVFTTIDGYTPKNKKLLQFPYVYMDGTNGNGGNAIYQAEKFYNTDYDGFYTFRCYGVLVPGCSIRMIPKFYNGLEVNNDEGLTLGKYPQLAWTTDQYTNWLTQNGVNVGINAAVGIGKIVGGLALAAATSGTAATFGSTMALSGGNDIIDSAKEIYDHPFTPPQAEGNINGGDVTTIIGYNKFRIKKMSIKQEFARIIDDYFDRLGYKTNRIKVPNQTGRTYWNYVQIGDKECIGYSNNQAISVPANAMSNINNMYRRGITIWHNHSNLGNYSLNNH